MTSRPVSFTSLKPNNNGRNATEQVGEPDRIVFDRELRAPDLEPPIAATPSALLFRVRLQAGEDPLGGPK